MTSRATRERMLIAFSAISALLVLFWALKFSRFGFDFTDEGFYLVSIANPFFYKWGISQFGFIYHPVYRIFGGDIGAIRAFNVVLTYGLSWVFANIVLKSFGPEDLKYKPAGLALAAGIATASLIAFDIWLLTPNYNTLALQALLLCSIGLLTAEKTISSRSISGWGIFGFGYWLLFMAKPSSAIALLLLAPCYLGISGKLSIRLGLWAGACAMAPLLAFALAADGSLYGFFHRLQAGLDLAGYLGGGHTIQRILRVDAFELNASAKLAMATLGALVIWAVWCSRPENSKYGMATIGVSGLLLSTCVLVIVGLVDLAGEFGQFQGMTVLSLVFAMVFIGSGVLQPALVDRCGRPEYAAAMFFAAMPYVFAFGTNNNYWRTGCSAAVFWLAAGVVMLSPEARSRLSWSFALPIGLATAALCAVLVQTGMENPYRQGGPLRTYDRTVRVGPSGAALTLPSGFADYIEAAVRVATEARFKANTSVIDMTGQSPGTIFVMGGQNLGAAWLLGGYPGSERFATEALRRQSCETLSFAWLLREPEGALRIPDGIVATFGGNLALNYETVGSWHTTPGVGGFTTFRQQVLMRPLNPETIAHACHNIRSGSNP